MSGWWDLGEWSGYRGNELKFHDVRCAFCGEEGNFEKVAHLERKKSATSSKKINYDTLKCGQCGNYLFVFWSAGNGLYSFRTLPWFQQTKKHPEHWPEDVGKYWLEARRSIESENWIAAAVMARSGVQLVARNHKAKGKNLE
ncbi:MAG: hypothetical protein ABIN69_09330, partial [Aestuariivirga sp.]